MKKIIVLLLIAGAAYWGYRHFDSFMAGPGSFDGSGKPTVLLFTMEGCGDLCGSVAADLRGRGIAFEEVNVSTDEGRSRIEKFGIMTVPLAVIGNSKVVGNDLPGLESALAEAYGMEVLSPLVRQVMQNHFDAQGKPQVVLYGTKTCPWCNKMREHLDGRKVPYQFQDVNRSSSTMRDFDALRGTGYPLLYVGYRRIIGFDTGLVDKTIKELL